MVTNFVLKNTYTHTHSHNFCILSHFIYIAIIDLYFKSYVLIKFIYINYFNYFIDIKSCSLQLYISVIIIARTKKVMHGFQLHQLLFVWLCAYYRLCFFRCFSMFSHYVICIFDIKSVTDALMWTWTWSEMSRKASS